MKRTIVGGGLAFLVSGVALAAFTSIYSVQQFPEPYSRIGEFTGTEFADYNINASGFYTCSTPLSGNADAPIEDACLATYTANDPIILIFNEDIYYVGLSAADGDYTIDDEAMVIMDAYSEFGEFLGTTAQTLLPANSLEEQNTGAVFLGIEADLPIHRVEVYSTIGQATTFDNLVFDEIVVDSGCSNTGRAPDLGLFSAMILATGLLGRRRRL